MPRNTKPAVRVRAHSTREAISDRVYAELLSRISDRKLVGGQVLVISELASEFGCSSIPVREALSRLRESQLIDYKSMHGFRVAPLLTQEETRALFIARLELESTAARYAAAGFDKRIAGQMADINGKIRRLSLGRLYRDYQEFVALNAAFHACMVSASGNRFLKQAYDALGYNAQSARILHGVGLPDQDSICAEHDAIVRHLSAGDRTEAVSMVRNHICDGYARLFNERLEVING